MKNLFAILFSKQEELDQRILLKFNLTSEETISERFLALLVEIGEFANETRCFKYWSNKLPSKKEVTLEELVDCLHFILSIGNHYGYQFHSDRDIDIKDYSDRDKSSLLIDLFMSVNEMRNNPTPANYIRIFDFFMNTAYKFEFTRYDIYSAYMRKNQINHTRQESGY